MQTVAFLLLLGSIFAGGIVLVATLGRCSELSGVHPAGQRGDPPRWRNGKSPDDDPGAPPPRGARLRRPRVGEADDEVVLSG